MTNLNRDPKGYYVALGIEETADADAIKTAFRHKAKRLHPDFNPSPIATKQFHRLHEAYETLSNPAKREAYDRPWQNSRKADPQAAGAARAYRKSAKTKRTENTESEKPTEAPNAERKSKFKAKPDPKTTSATDQPAICKCGRITAQPRYIIFDLVWGRITHAHRRGISGIFCRSCADRTAIRASLLTWIAGWWAWPNGPKETVKALLSNMRGGRKPPERNAKLLIRQSRAFRARGEMELARNAAEQALIFATTAALRRDVDSLLLSLSAHPSRTLKNRWAKPGWAATVQVMPLAFIVAAISMMATVSAPTYLTDALRNAFVQGNETAPLAGSASVQKATEDVVGRVFSIADETASLRTGPGLNYQLVAVLAKDTVVLATEADPGGAWLRVTAADGTAGFVNIEQLSSNVRAESVKALGGLGKSPAPIETESP